MGSGNRYQCLHFQSESDEATEESQKQSKVSYTREFLLSLCELDICKKPPSGFNPSLLGESECANSSLFSGCSRGICGKWETNSCVLIERHGQHSHPDPRRLYGNQYQCSWQNSEHDGLLGTGGFSRGPAHIVATTVSKVQGIGHKNYEPYCPPNYRPFKAATNSGTGIESKDLFNDETFGLVESLSDDRAEEEKRRRAAFELIRKEQQKAMNEKQKLVADEHKENSDSAVAKSQEDASSNEAIVHKFNELEDHVEPRASNVEFAISSSAESPASRPLFPPGFTSRITEKNLREKSLHCACGVEVGNDELEDGNAYGQITLMNTNCDSLEEKLIERYVRSIDQQHENEKITANLRNESKNVVRSSYLVGQGNVTGDKVKTMVVEDYSALTCDLISESARAEVSFNKIGKGLEHLAASSKLNMGSSEHQPFDRSILNTPSKGHTAKSKNNMFLKRLPGGEFVELQSVEVSVSVQRDTVARSAEDSSAFDCKISRSAEGIMASGFGKQTGLDVININHSGSGNAHAEIGSNLHIGQKMNLNPFVGFDEKVDSAFEVCLPAEDSLITIDDPILPQYSLSLSAGNSLKGGFPTSNMPIHIAEKLAALSIPFSDERCTVPHLGGPTFCHDSYSDLGLETSYLNLHAHQSNPQFHQPNLNLGGPYFRSLNHLQSHLDSQIKSMDWRSYYHNPLPYHNDFPASMCFSSPYAHAKQMGFDHPIHQSAVQQMHMPGKHASYQSNALSRSAPLPQPLNQNASYAEGLSPVERFHLSCQQLGYEGLGMPNQDPGSFCANKNRIAFNRLIDMERWANQMNPSAIAAHDQVNYNGDQVDMRHQYENRSLW